MDQRDIIILTDFEEGHIYPLFNLARNFEKARYSISFVGILDTVDIIKKHGFECIPIFQKSFPRGYVKSLKENGDGITSVSSNKYMESIFEDFDKFMPFVKPKIVFVNSYFSLLALLIHYKYGVKQIIFHTFFPQLMDNSAISMSQFSANHAISNFMELPSQLISLFMGFFEKNNIKLENVKDLTAPLKKMSHVMLCPKEFEIHKPEPNLNEIYLGPGINTYNDLQSDFSQELLKKKGNKKIIYVSLGSQTHTYPKKAVNFFKLILGIMESKYMKNFYLVLSLGSIIGDLNLKELPENVDVYSWVPQIEVLKLASIAVIHGGLGSIKECIFFGVSMLIVPMGRDQVDNGKRVEHHEIGYLIRLDTITEKTLLQKIKALMEDKKTRENLSHMQHVFQERENQKKEIELVQTLI